MIPSSLWITVFNSEVHNDSVSQQLRYHREYTVFQLCASAVCTWLSRHSCSLELSLIHALLVSVALVCMVSLQVLCWHPQGCEGPRDIHGHPQVKERERGGRHNRETERWRGAGSELGNQHGDICFSLPLFLSVLFCPVFASSLVIPLPSSSSSLSSTGIVYCPL